MKENEDRNSVNKMANKLDFSNVENAPLNVAVRIVHFNECLPENQTIAEISTTSFRKKKSLKVSHSELSKSVFQ